jgi:hypothetical protein
MIAENSSTLSARGGGRPVKWVPIATLIRGDALCFGLTALDGATQRGDGRGGAAMMLEIELATESGAVLISEDDVVTNAQLKQFRLSRKELHEIFARGAKLMEGKTASDRVRPVAAEKSDSTWDVRLVQDFPSSDPLSNILI